MGRTGLSQASTGTEAAALQPRASKRSTKVRRIGDGLIAGLRDARRIAAADHAIEHNGGDLRIVLAYDLSPDSERAGALIGSARWPARTVLRVVTSPVGVGAVLSSSAGPAEARANAQKTAQSIAIAHARLAGELASANLAVETVVRPGSPEDAILAEASAFDADLVVAGARGRGAIASTLLGSVSAALAESARCSVLIARGTSTRRVVLALDGSSGSMAAARVVETWPLFGGARMLVIGVGSQRFDAGRLAGDALAESNHDEGDTSGVTLPGIVDDVVQRMTAAGRDAIGEVRIGQADVQISAVAGDSGADVVAISCNRQPMLRRLLLGSVTRKILHGVRCSVLIVRPPVRDAGAAQAHAS